MRALAVLGAIVVLPLAGCGGGDGRSDGAPSAASRPAGAGATTVSSTEAPVLAAGDERRTLPANAPSSQASSAATTAPANSPPTTTSATAAAPTSAAPTEHAPEPARATITIQGFRFDPPLLRVTPGTRVTATNKDSPPHTWTAGDGRWDSGRLEQGQSFTVTFATVGTFTYRCTIHPSMTGTVTVDQV